MINCSSESARIALEKFGLIRPEWMVLFRKVFVHLFDIWSPWRSVGWCAEWAIPFFKTTGFNLTYPTVITEPRIRLTSAMCYLCYQSKTIQDVNNDGVVLFNHIANARLWSDVVDIAQVGLSESGSKSFDVEAAPRAPRWRLIDWRRRCDDKCNIFLPLQYILHVKV